MGTHANSTTTIHTIDNNENEPTAQNNNMHHPTDNTDQDQDQDTTQNNQILHMTDTNTKNDTTTEPETTV